MKKSIKITSRRLPPHSNEAWPPAHGGEAKKPLVIALIVIVGIIFLSLLLFSERLFVGKAFTGLPNTAGLVDPGTITEGQQFSLMVQANLPNEPTTAINFTLQLPPGTSCAGVVTTNLLGWTASGIEQIQCVNNLLEFTSATYDLQDARSGTFNIASLSIPGLSAGNYDFQFSNFDAINAVDPRQSNPTHDLITNGLGVTVTVAAPAPTAVCGNGILEGNEECDQGNTVNGDGCSSTCTVESGYGCSGQPSECVLPGGQGIDSDADGVPDATDNCPNVANAAQTDLDNDLVGDACDSCVGTDCAGIIVDSDNDGVQDADDLCPNTPATETANANGCSASQITPTSNSIGTFETRITANVAITEATVYTILKDVNGRILVLKSEKMLNVPAGGEYIASVAYPAANLVRSKEVVVYDRLPDQGWTVHGGLVDSDVSSPRDYDRSGEVGIRINNLLPFGGCPAGTTASACVDATSMQCTGSSQYGDQIISCLGLTCRGSSPYAECR